MRNKKSIIIFCDYFLPGFRAGGPVRSIAAMVEVLKDDFDITLVTRNHDRSVQESYLGIKSDELREENGYRILYLSPKNTFSGIREILKNNSYHVVYVNSYTSPKFTVYPLYLTMIRRWQKSRIIFAPRGELNEGAYSIRNTKKKIFTFFFKRLFQIKNIEWHATSLEEKQDIKRLLGNHLRVITLPNISIPEKKSDSVGRKEPNQIRLVFISRISQKKNVAYAIKLLSNITGKVIFDIYGPIEDQAHWQACLQAIEKLPKNIEVHYRGEIAHHQVMNTLRSYDLFYLTTLGENYGHAIVEALSAGCPVLISNQTPWTDIEERKAGWAFSLSQPALFAKKINELIPMDSETYLRYQNSAREYYVQMIASQSLAGNYQTFFGTRAEA